MRCEASAFEDCVNCPADCGECPLRSCSESLGCLFGCFDIGGGGVPGIDFGCLTGCYSHTCANARAFLDNVLNCALNVFASGTCSDLSCMMRQCQGEIVACLGHLRC